MPNKWKTIAWVMAALLAVGCQRAPQGEAPAAAESGSGTIIGRVILTGTPPEMKIIPGSPQVKDESILVGPHGGLQNVIVYLADAPKSADVLQTPAVLDQVNCVYVPHVLAVQTGQTLRIKSSDANMLHNVHLKCAVNPDENFGFNGIGQRDITLNQPEAPFPVRCDVHPWMGAWIGVFDHPWFAVTDVDGRFTIHNVPPGHYTIAAWQEALPQQQQAIDVAATGQTESDFTFQGP